jgi:hypothetical protein
MHYQFALAQGRAPAAAVVPAAAVAPASDPAALAHARAPAAPAGDPANRGGLFAKLREAPGEPRATARPTPPRRPAPRNDSCANGVVALTYASHRGRDDRFCRSLESAIRNGLDLRVLGWGVKWEGLSQKLGAALEAVEALPADCPVVFTDAYDVLFARGGESMRRAFDAIGKPLVFSAECGCWPQVTRDKGRTCRDKYPKSPTPYRYLNSGSWAGRASVAARFLRAIGAGGTDPLAFHRLNDQELASELYMAGGFPGLALDHGATLFQAMHAVKDTTLVPDCDPRPDLVEERGSWINKRTGSAPAVFHFNGGGKRHHLAMEARTWWKRCENAQALAALARVEATELLFNGRRQTFGAICPGHLAQARGAGDLPCADRP